MILAPDRPQAARVGGRTLRRIAAGSCLIAVLSERTRRQSTDLRAHVPQTPDQTVGAVVPDHGRAVIHGIRDITDFSPAAGRLSKAHVQAGRIPTRDGMDRSLGVTNFTTCSGAGLASVRIL